MQNGKQTLIIIGIVVAALLGTVAWSYFSGNKKPAEESVTKTEVVSNLTNIDAKSQDATLKKEYALANEKAVAANPGNKIAKIETTIGSSLQVEDVSTRYIFVSDSDKANNWLITISLASQNFIRALIPKEDYAGDLLPIDLKNWKFSYISALQYAEKEGGLDWRESNTLKSVSISLRQSTAETAVWTVEYTGDTNNFSVSIDPVTGAKVSI